MQILTTLGIEWQQLLAQAINFAIIMGVLAYFVYKPVMRVIDARTERIRKAMEEAEEVENQKKELEKFRQQQLSEIDKEAGKILEKAKQEAERMRKDILDNAQKETALMIEKAEKQLANERARVFSEVQDTVGNMIITMTEKILEREFSAKDQERLMKSLEKELPQMLA
ncbi:MAG TPA: F0F1 ATP synthase subunit B [Candidatus Peribacteraceae bacterium]|nr:F0F1 ATP synthase subunit B [Candidatus Peribacteraceae bacterium]